MEIQTRVENTSKEEIPLKHLPWESAHSSE